MPLCAERRRLKCNGVGPCPRFHLLMPFPCRPVMWHPPAPYALHTRRSTYTRPRPHQPRHLSTQLAPPRAEPRHAAGRHPTGPDPGDAAPRARACGPRVHWWGCRFPHPPGTTSHIPHPHSGRGRRTAPDSTPATGHLPRGRPTAARLHAGRGPKPLRNAVCARAGGGARRGGGGGGSGSGAAARRRASCRGGGRAGGLGRRAPAGCRRQKDTAPSLHAASQRRKHERIMNPSDVPKAALA